MVPMPQRPAPMPARAQPREPDVRRSGAGVGGRRPATSLRTRFWVVTWVLTVVPFGECGVVGGPCRAGCPGGQGQRGTPVGQWAARDWRSRRVSRYLGDSSGVAAPRQRGHAATQSSRRTGVPPLRHTRGHVPHPARGDPASAGDVKRSAGDHQAGFGPDLVEVFGPSQQDGGPELIQLLTPEGERVHHPEFDLDFSAEAAARLLPRHGAHPADRHRGHRAPAPRRARHLGPAARPGGRPDRRRPRAAPAGLRLPDLPRARRRLLQGRRPAQPARPVPRRRPRRAGTRTRTTSASTRS